MRKIAFGMVFLLTTVVPTAMAITVDGLNTGGEWDAIDPITDPSEIVNWSSGYDIVVMKWYYDIGNDTFYAMLSANGTIGDADGNGNPDDGCRTVIGAGEFCDFPGIGADELDNEEYKIRIDGTKVVQYKANTVVTANIDLRDAEVNWTDGTDGIIEFAITNAIAYFDPHNFMLSGFSDANQDYRAEDYTETVIVFERPVPVIDFKGTGCLEVELNASRSYDPDGYITTYEWDLDDDETYEINMGSDPLLPVTFDSCGYKTIGLRVTDNSSLALTNSTNRTIYVNCGPIANATANKSTVYFPGEWVLFDGSGSVDPENDQLVYTWDINGNPFTDEISVEYFVDDNTTATLTVYDPNSTCTDTDSVEVKADLACPLPIADADGPYIVCVGYPVKFDGSGSLPADEITEYCWDVDDDGTYDHCSSSPIYEYTYPGTYSGDAVLKVTSRCGNDTDTAYVLVDVCRPAAVPILTPAGIFALIGLLCVVGASRVMKKRQEV